MAPAATALVATSVVVTSLLTPVITALWARRFGVLSPRYRAQMAAAQSGDVAAAAGAGASQDVRLTARVETPLE